jgi:Holliday junction resolvasome RuvABC DNA-binding subunit
VTLAEHLRAALAHLDEALVEAFEELVQMGFAERSARSVVQHLHRARRDIEDVLLLITIFAKTNTPRWDRGE